VGVFVESGVLFVGLHVVNGNFYDEQEFTTRNGYNYEWVMGMANFYWQDIRAIVVFGNARPGLPQNKVFFAPMGELLANEEFIDIPTLHVHAASGNEGTSAAEYQPFNNVLNLVATEVSLPP
jgi:hypothetical protein